MFLLGTALAEGSSGFVNLKDGSFQTKISNDSLERLALDYSSRRNATGLFGAGWCSTLDRQLRPGRGKQIEFVDCDVVLKLSPAPVSALVKGENASYRAEDGTTLEREGRSYLLQTANRLHRFDLDGQLIETVENEVTTYKLLDARSSGDGRRLRLQVRGQLMDLTLDSQGLVQFLTRLGNGRLAFRYDGRRLSSVNESALLKTNSIQELASFAYDTEDNMTEESRGGTPVFIGYDRRADRVRTVKSENECSENYEYETRAGPKNGPALVSEVVQVRRLCETTTQLILRLENDYLKTPDAELILIESRRINARDKTIRRFHPLLGSLEEQRTTPNLNRQEFQPNVRPKTRLASE